MEEFISTLNQIQIFCRMFACSKYRVYNGEYSKPALPTHTKP